MGIRAAAAKEGESKMTLLNRRLFLGSAAAVLGAGTAVSAEGTDKIKILAVNGSPRTDKTTVSALLAALSAAQTAGEGSIETEMIHLADYDMFGSERVFGKAWAAGAGNPFSLLAEKISEKPVRGIIFGTPVHNGLLSVLTSSFFDQVPHSVLSGKIGGALAVGAARNGGQEAAVQALHSFMLHEGMILAGSGRAGGGAFLWNHDDSIDDDTAGLGLARSLGERVARLAQIVPAEIFD